MLHKVSKFSLGFDPDGVLGGQICHDQCVNICLRNRTRRSSCIQIDKLLFDDWHMIVADVCKNIEQLEASNQSVIILFQQQLQSKRQDRPLTDIIVGRCERKRESISAGEGELATRKLPS